MLKLLSGLGLSSWIAIALGALLLVQTARIEGFGIWPIKVPGLKAELKDARSERDKLEAQLRSLAEQSARKQAETAKRLEEARKNVRTVERVVTKLENRPVTVTECRTPDVEEWRGVL